MFYIDFFDLDLFVLVLCFFECDLFVAIKLDKNFKLSFFCSSERNALNESNESVINDTLGRCKLPQQTQMGIYFILIYTSIHTITYIHTYIHTIHITT